MQNMQDMPNMLAYTGVSSYFSGSQPRVTVGTGSTAVTFRPSNPQDNSYYILILDRMNPRTMVKDFVIPGQNNSKVPDGLDNYMTNPQYIFAVLTQFLGTNNVPQGDFFDYLVKYGGGRKLHEIEQLNTVIGCGNHSRVAYLLTGQCGRREAGKPAPTTYEYASLYHQVYMLMSLMPMPDGSGPYSICNHQTFKTR